ncbi:MAG: hypothetical protein FWD48_09845 [Oscillospiraceae bacterium]|nr:hypothetical protein [Oscillospiraceae bacterium]
MSTKLKKFFNHFTYAILSNTIYGFIVYFLYTWLIGFSLLYVYLANLALILLFLALDEGMLRILEPKKLAEMIKEDKNRERSSRQILWVIDSFVSFKTVLYLFYILVLVAAQIIDSYPALLNENLMNFIHANNYSILVLIAADQLVGQFSKDRKRLNKISAKLKEDLGESS